MNKKLTGLAVAIVGAVAATGLKGSPAANGGIPATKPVPAAATALSKEDQEALELGRKVVAVKRAIANPNAADAMKAITDLGHDSRYYVMIRGWLIQQLAGDQSIADAKGANTTKELQDRIVFLKKAIRAIDLE